MRVLLASRAFPPMVGGIERFAESFAEWLSERGHEVIVATRAPPGSEEPDRPYRVMRSPGVAAFVEAARRSDVVHVSGLSLRAVVPAVTARRPTVVTHHGHQAVCPTGLCLPTGGVCNAGPSPGPCGACPSQGAMARIDVRGHRAAAGVVSANVAVSDYLCRRQGLPSTRTILNPVMPEVFAAADWGSGEDRLIAFAGRLVAEKGVELLLRAINLVPDARLEIVGEGPMLGRLRDLTEELGLSLRVSFLGRRSIAGVADAYRRAAVVCVPSLWDEPFGFAAAEAMAMQRPLVVTPSGALPELCAEERGFVAEHRTAKALASALSEALADGEERARRAARARVFAQHALSADRAGSAYESVYEEVVA